MMFDVCFFHRYIIMKLFYIINLILMARGFWDLWVCCSFFIVLIKTIVVSVCKFVILFCLWHVQYNLICEWWINKTLLLLLLMKFRLHSDIHSDFLLARKMTSWVAYLSEERHCLGYNPSRSTAKSPCSTMEMCSVEKLSAILMISLVFSGWNTVIL